MNARELGSSGLSVSALGFGCMGMSEFYGPSEESGSLDEMLLKIAHFFDRDIEYTVRRLTTLMEPVLTIVLGVIVGFIVLSLYMPIFTLADVIKR